MSSSPQQQSNTQIQRIEQTNIILFCILLIMVVFLYGSWVNSYSLDRRIQETNRQLYKIESELRCNRVKQEINNENP